MTELGKYRKTLAAIIGGVLTWGYTAQDGGITAKEWWGLGLAIATVLGVFGAPNEPLEDDDGGQTTVDFVIKVMVVVLLAVVLIAVFSGHR